MSHRSIRIPDDLEARIVERAMLEQRTFSSMAVLLLKRALSERGLPPDGAEGSHPSRLAGSGSRSESAESGAAGVWTPSGNVPSAAVPQPRASAPDRDFKGPDPKPPKAEKKGRR